MLVPEPGRGLLDGQLRGGEVLAFAARPERAPVPVAEPVHLGVGDVAQPPGDASCRLEA